MKKQKLLLLLAIAVCFANFTIGNVSAFNFTLGVAIGDEIVWKYTEIENGVKNISYLKYSITDIYDQDENATFIVGETYTADEEPEDFLLLTNETITFISEDTIATILTFQLIIESGMKIGDHKDEITTGGDIRSIQYGRGIKVKFILFFTDEVTSLTIVYTEDGILEKYHDIGLNSEALFELYSVNDTKHRTIPGMPIGWILGILAFSAIIIISKFKKLTHCL